MDIVSYYYYDINDANGPWPAQLSEPKVLLLLLEGGVQLLERRSHELSHEDERKGNP